ncbi:hypothetical protein C8T65DRAFT_2043 [Cerioporus squamosus]|nr:hypothetical protein C8T65DRAFT_2043 [Cerioporus squamosus]
MDNDDYLEGYEVMATPSWIKREKKLFASTLNMREVEEESSGEDEPMPSTSHVKTEPTNKRKGKAPAIKKRGRPPKKFKRERSLGDEDDESDSMPLSAVRKKGKQRAKPIVDSDEDDEDDEPLAKVKKPVTAPSVPRSVRLSRSNKRLNLTSCPD